jgi:hypothetical protein
MSHCQSIFQSAKSWPIIPLNLGVFHLMMCSANKRFLQINRNALKEEQKVNYSEELQVWVSRELDCSVLAG